MMVAAISAVGTAALLRTGRRPAQLRRAHRAGCRSSVRLDRRGLLGTGAAALAGGTAPRDQARASGLSYEDAWIEEQEQEASPITLSSSSPTVCTSEGVSLRTSLTLPAAQGFNSDRFPLVIFSCGFATEASQYTELAEALARGGCAVLRYDASGAVGATDRTLVSALRSVMDYSARMPELEGLAGNGRIVLAGHSRGAKLSSLAAVADERVAGLCLLDPVDNTVWAPVSPGFPSACAALREFQEREERSRLLPLAVVGAGGGGDCAPAEANYWNFYHAAGSPAWLLEIPAAGHAQFLDRQGISSRVQRAFCGSKGAEDAAVLVAAEQACLAMAQAACGPAELLPGASAASELAAARVEVAQRLARTPQSTGGCRCREAALAVGVAASVTAGRLRQRGVQFESLVKL